MCFGVMKVNGCKIFPSPKAFILERKLYNLSLSSFLFIRKVPFSLAFLKQSLTGFQSEANVLAHLNYEIKT